MDYQKELDTAAAADCLRRLPASDAAAGMVNLSTNDYLGLNDNETLVERFRSQYNITTASMSAASSRLLTGNHREYALLEQTLGDLYGGRSALVFNCGYHANTGVLPALTDKHDLILADKLSHASLIDGMRLCEATVMRFRHNDMRHLRTLLEANRAKAQNCFIVTESIFSMDGDLAPVEELAALKKEFGCMLYVDEAHGVGVRGRAGEGLMGERGLAHEADILVGTCGKALASEGAFVICSELVKKFLVNRCRTIIFTTGLPAVNVAWTRFMVETAAGMESERRHLLELAETLSLTLTKGLGPKADSQIVPFVCGENEAAVALSLKMREAGFYVLPIRHPTVPKGQARLRFSLKANMTFEELAPIAKLV